MRSGRCALTVAAVWAAAAAITAPPAGARAAIAYSSGGGPARSPMVVVVEEDTNRVSFFAADPGNPVPLARFGGNGSEPGRFSRPYGAVIDHDTIWVTDRLSGRLQAFDLTGRHLRTVALSAPPGQRVPEPGAPALSRTGDLIVPDLSNDQLIVLRTDGHVLARWGGPGRQTGRFMQPVAVTVSPVDGRIFTVEAFEPRIQIFDPDGRWRGVLGAGSLVKPTKAVVDATGRLYVADEALNQIVRFTAAGEIDLRWGGYGTGSGDLFLPEGMAFDDRQRLWVIDHGNHRGQIFTADGLPLGSFATGQIGVLPGALPVRPSSASRAEPTTWSPIMVAGLGLLVVAGCARAVARPAT